MAYFDSHPTERSHSNAWTVVDGKKFYTPRDLLRQAAPRAGWRIRDEEIPRVEAKWREHLVALDFHVSGFGLGSVADNDPPKPELSRRTKPRPADISAENVRAAARVWDKGRGFKNFGVAKKFQVWIDAAGDDVLTPYPVKAIVALAARDAGRRPLRTDEFAGADNGPWHRQLKKLGFPVLPIAVSPNGAVAIPVVLKGAQRGSRRAASLSANELKDTLKQGEKVLAPKDPTDAAIERLLKRGRLPTEAKRQVRARLGQGTFRSALLAAYGECALTGETVREVLRAAHIQRWADCDDDLDARLDLHNGLLLSANLDCLFEVGLIAIDAKGHLLISDELDDGACARLGIHPGMPLRWPISARRAAYFQIHRERAGFEADNEDDEDVEAIRKAFAW
ncbi:HNH endonuclease [Cupriavidus metallidurans]|uniref:HNH endonuclease n=1 Tax=Cupriavidus sp. HMR-1 TaxID=1249621 RepID=UPI0003164003|nr:HNH endonuclease [Cupriavidus sp. HMR-1]